MRLVQLALEETSVLQVLRVQPVGLAQRVLLDIQDRLATEVRRVRWVRRVILGLQVPLVHRVPLVLLVLLVPPGWSEA